MLDPLATPPSSNNTNKTVEEEDTTVVEQWTLRIKSFQDVYVQVPSNSVVSLLKDKARSALGKNNDKDDADADDNLYLRLICKGRLLTPDHALIQEFNVQDGDAVHAVLAQPAPPPSSTTTGTATATTTTIPTSNNGHRRRRRQRGTVVGPGGRVTRATIQGGENEDPDSSSSSGDDREEGRERMGFDRLRSNGLSRQEITAIRAYFSRHVERYVQQHANSNNNTDEPDLTRRRLMMEDDWMALQGPASEFRLNLNQNTLLRFANMPNNPAAFRTTTTTLGSDRDFMWGFVLGFFVGFVMLIWVWMPTIPHKQKLGILTGISFQLALNVLQEEQEDEFDQD